MARHNHQIIFCLFIFAATTTLNNFFPPILVEHPLNIFHHFAFRGIFRFAPVDIMQLYAMINHFLPQYEGMGKVTRKPIRGEDDNRADFASINNSS